MNRLRTWCSSLLLPLLMASLLVACGSEDGGAPLQSDQEGGAGVTIQSLQVTPAQRRIPVALEQQFIALATLSDGSVRNVTLDSALHWSSGNAAVATITATGLATGIAPGTAIITASGTVNGVNFRATAELTVTSAVVTALQVTPAVASVPIGFEQPFTAAVFLSDGSSLDVTHAAALNWSSSNPAVARIDSGSTDPSKKGLATGLAVGAVTITASVAVNGTTLSATAQLTVTGTTVTALQITPATASIPVGLEQSFTATVFLSDGSSRDVTNNAALSWSSSNGSVAVINATGRATGIAPGTTNITAAGTANGVTFSATAQLAVTGTTVTALQITPATASIPVGLEQSFVATAFLSDGSSLDITNNVALSWSSSNPAIATIASGGTSNNGLATGVTVGNAIITASGTANGTHFSATAALTVTSAVVTALQVTPATASVPVGFEQPFVAIASLSDGSSRDVTSNAALSWRSSDPAIATVDSGSTVRSNKGLATGVAQGAVIITATAIVNGTTFSATAQLAVTSAVVAALQITPPTASIPVGLEQSFVATAFLSDGSSRDITNNVALSWSSSNPTIATIASGGASNNGLATGITAGTVTITASGTANGTHFSAEAVLTVTNAVVTALQVTPATAAIPAGFEQPFVAIASLSDGSSRDVTSNAALSWRSSNPAIATIDSGSTDPGNKGLATGITAGTATITASSTTNGTHLTATAALTVTSAVVTALQISPATDSVFVGTEQAFVAIALLSDGGSLDVTNNAALSWSSSDPAIATIGTGGTGNNGVATGRAEGTVTVTASGIAGATSFTATAALTVTVPSGCDIGSLMHLALIYICTPTQAEADANGIVYDGPWPEDGRLFVLMNWGQAEIYCNGLGSGYRLPTNSELRDLYFRYGPLHTYAGWPSNFWYWTSTGLGGEHSAVNITNGDSEQRGDTVTHYVSCVR